MFWQNRNSENMLYGGSTGSPSPTRRSSIERLQKASRVKNSNILALEQKQEYDPTRLPQIERPLSKVQGNSFRTSNSGGLWSPGSDRTSIDFNHSGSSFSSAIMSPKQTMPPAEAAPTPSKSPGSPTKSSLSPSKFKSSLDRLSGDWTADSSVGEHDLPSGRSLHRHAKSVTFDAAPPQINEYEMATPDLSSIGTNSREGSYESLDDEDDDDDLLYDPANVHNHEDSFDASLEDTDKTPVVGPDDWRGESPMVHGRQSLDWEGSPMPETSASMTGFERPRANRSDSVTSNGEHRPLPPLPGAGHSRTHSNGSAPASPGLSAAAERMLGSHRSLPSPPAASASKTDIQNIGNGKMTLEERLKLMMLSDDNGAKTAAEQQRERRLRRGNGRERFGSPISEPESTTSALEAQEEDDTIGDISGLDDYELPSRISRESIMRRVNGNRAFDRESDYNFSSPAPSLGAQRSPTRSPERQISLDPDVPIPSTEDSILLEDISEEEEGSVIINRDAAEHYDSEDDYSYDMSQQSDIEDQESEGRLDDDDYRRAYSEQSEDLVDEAAEKKPEPEEATTPTANTPTQTTTLGDSIPDLGPNTRHSAFSREFEAYMLPESQEAEEQQEEAVPKDQRPITPNKAMSKPEYDGSGWGEPDEEYDDEPGTPESVIHHPVSEIEDEEVFEDEPKESPTIPKESPAIPERVATVKASNSKLKTRVSNTPSDLAAMREARRQVSYEVPNVPPIPERHRNRLSRDATTEQAGDEFPNRHPSFHKRSLTLDLDLGLSLDQDFERVIEAQKVALNNSLHKSSPTPRNNTSRQASTPSPDSITKDPSANVASRHQRGYLMRQNTKLVSASDKDAEEPRTARSAGNSPIKKERPQTWTVEPWNSKTRKVSVRRKSGAVGHAPSGPAPPMPGQQSNATTLRGVVEEDDQAEQAPPESGERGRLFVKVMGVKDLDLPIPKSKSPSLPWFRTVS